MAESPDPGQVEEAAIALDGVDETKNLVEPGAVVRHGFPGDDLPRERLQHLPRFRDEIVDEIVHLAPPLSRRTRIRVGWLRRGLLGSHRHAGEGWNPC